MESTSGQTGSLSVQTLISTMGRNDLEFLNDMHLETDVVVGNQNGKDSKYSCAFNGYQVTVVESSVKGLSRNRNLTIDNAVADICIVADDDIEYCQGYRDIVTGSFAQYPDADILIFNLYEDPVERYVIREPHRVRGLEFLRYGSVRIALKRRSVEGTVRFDEMFGAGGEIPIGEDTIFLGDCLKKGLVIYALPAYILRLKESESSWFKGYTRDYFFRKGMMYYRIFGSLSWIINLQDAVRHRKQYRSCGSPFSVFSIMNDGSKEMRRRKKNQTSQA